MDTFRFAIIFFVWFPNSYLFFQTVELFLLEIIEKKIFLHFLPVICYVFCPEKRTTQSHFCLFVKLNRKFSYNFLAVSNGLCHLLKYLFLFQILKIRDHVVFKLDLSINEKVYTPFHFQKWKLFQCISKLFLFFIKIKQKIIIQFSGNFQFYCVSK